MTVRSPISILALFAAVPMAAHAQSVSDFTLEPAPTATATPQPQGPADTRNGVEIRPRSVNTPTPIPSPVVTPIPSPRPSIVPSEPVTRTEGLVPDAPPTNRPNTATPSPRPSQPVDGPASQPEATGDPAPASATPPVSTPAAVDPVPDLPAVNAAPGGDEEAFPWLPVGVAAALLALLAVGGFFWRRRRDTQVPEIERPTVSHASASLPATMSDAVHLSVDYDKLIRSAAYATLKYRITLVNRTDSPLTDVSVGADLVSAHAGAPMEEQVASGSTTLETRHELPRIAPRQSVSLQGQVQLPLAGAHIIRQGRFPLLVPLMRVRGNGPCEGALVKTMVIGQGAPGGGRVQPFRLDEGPRSYEPIAQRELA